jgi:hypothetical protein
MQGSNASVGTNQLVAITEMQRHCISIWVVIDKRRNLRTN